MIDPGSPVQIRMPGPHAGGTSWKSAALGSDLSLLGDSTTLRLPSDPQGAFRLASADGSLGRLTLPRNIAIDGDLRVYLLDRDSNRILIHDPAQRNYDPAQPFQPIPGLEGEGTDETDNPRRLLDPVAIAADSAHLYVVDHVRREDGIGCGYLGGGVGKVRGKVLVFALDTWALSEIWELDEPAEVPIDVATHRDIVYVLTPSGLYDHRPGDESPRLAQVLPADTRPWSRLAIDAQGWVYLLRTEPSPVLDVWVPGHGLMETHVNDPTEVRDAFVAPAVTTWPVEPPKYYLIPDALARSCGRVWPDTSIAVGLALETDPIHAPPSDQGRPMPDVGFVVDLTGCRIDSAMLRPPRLPLFRRKGVWISHEFDSTLYRCQWDVAVLHLLDLAPGTLVDVSTFTSDDKDAVGVGTLPPEDAWTQGYAVGGGPRAPGSPGIGPIEFLIDSPPGRYLWLRVQMEGDGFVTPGLGSVDLRMPRQSYTQYLPAVFLEDEPSRRFLERFLAIFQAEWDSLEKRVDAIPALADPRVVPESQIDVLAGWLGQTFEPGWSVDQRRQMLSALPAALFAGRSEGQGKSHVDASDGTPLPGGTRRGTPAALRDYLRITLRSQRKEFDPIAYPFIIEGFRERDYRILCQQNARASALSGVDISEVDGEPAEVSGAGAPIWGPDEIGRFRLGESSQLDEDRLLPGGDADLDVFTQHAHRFRVIVPAVLVPDAASEALLRREIEAEKPAHTAYELDLIGPRFRVGVQSTVGIDTILGGLPTARLERGSGGPAEAPSAPAGNRLGYDTVLSTVSTPPPRSLSDGRPGRHGRGDPLKEARLGVGNESRAN